MSSYIFEAKVAALNNALEEALPEIRERFGEPIDKDGLIDMIGSRELMDLATNNMLSSSVRSIRGESGDQRLSVGIVSLYERAKK